MSGPDDRDQHVLHAQIARAQSGDPRAFERILQHHQSGLLRFCTSMLVSFGDAEDVFRGVSDRLAAAAYLASTRGTGNLAVPDCPAPVYRSSAETAASATRSADGRILRR